MAVTSNPRTAQSRKLPNPNEKKTNTPRIYGGGDNKQQYWALSSQVTRNAIGYEMHQGSVRGTAGVLSGLGMPVWCQYAGTSRGPRKIDKILGYLEVLSEAWLNEHQTNKDQDVTLHAIRSGFRAFSRDVVTHVGTEVKKLKEGVEKFCAGVIEGAKVVAIAEAATRPRKEPVKLKFPDAYRGKKDDSFDNWETIINTYVYLQHIAPEEQVLVAFHALKDEAASFARSLARATDREHNMIAYSRLTPFSTFLKLLRERFANVTRGVRASDKLQTIHSRQWRSARALKAVMDDLVAVPDHGVTETQLVQLFYHAMPEPLQGHFFDKTQQTNITYDPLSGEVVLFEAKSMPVSSFWHKDLDKGLANYYRKFVRNLSTIAAPLRRLLKKEAIWQWDKDCTSALKKLKRALIEYPVLKVADPSLPFVVTTDASQYGIGVVLQQDDGNGYRPIEFMSARMPSEKVATSTYERDLYALRQALEHWKHYLPGRHFKVYSDHETLRWLKTQAKMTAKLTRWAAEIDQYDFELKPVKGKYNVVADAQSRRSDYFGAIVHYLDIGSDLQEKVRQTYAQDPIYSDLVKRVQEAQKPNQITALQKGCYLRSLTS
ncbi:hypothetical protein CBR_g41526 [Chara braunii]|uniref:Reverse transcriptase RNase H-like domain-containing protein n=1 Tax=Chara braunii TaxID=69332 RepID=A0A388K2S9_CHABU|nr:hypothetical protein CBR_g41526 [Chara braunii]|eukprot:GBG64325.1 hypothetical protein CBR_g41526 [Chara braunii]